MQQFLQFRLGCHGLLIAAGHLAGAGHVDRADRLCLACNSGFIAMNSIWFLNVLPWLLCGSSMQTLH